VKSLPKEKGKFKLEFPMEQVKIKPWQTALLVLYFAFMYFLVDFLKAVLDTKFQNDSFIVIVIILIVILLIGAVTIYMARKLSEKH